MIVFDLGCPAGHVFEAWFGSSSDYEAQRGRGLVSCPVCGAVEVDKAVMAPRVGLKANQRDGSPARAPASTAIDDPAQAKAVMRALAGLQADMLKGSDWVGPRFADEARAIHLGEAEARSIHGEASLDEARALRDEGIDVAPLPFSVRPPGGDN